MSDWWYFPKPQPRRSAKGGIRARSQRGDIGETWWSRRFVEVLESFSDVKRLQRGRSYARSGQVMQLKIEPGRVTARVQGSRPEPYRVRIGLEPLSPAEWVRVEQTLAERAIFLAALLAGTMPQNIEEAFASTNLSLFPGSADELRTECSCPDWANPCKHVAATYYILAEAFDEDPFLILAWRGRGKDELLARLRELRGAAGAEPADEREEAEEVEPLEDRLADFWAAGPELETLAFAPRAAEVPDAILRELGPAPVDAAGRPLRELLAPAYGVLSRTAADRALAGGEAAAP
jgi:uncharacterized Zn finger protein